MKRCNKCLEFKEVSEFNKHKTQKDGHHITCRNCCSLANKVRYEAKKAEIKQKTSSYKKANRDKANDWTRNWRATRLQLERDKRKIWRDNNLNLVREMTALRRARKKQAAIDYEVCKPQIIEIYKNCPKGMHVDHIIPLCGKDICGLHVPWNLQYLTPEENSKKGTRYERN